MPELGNSNVSGFSDGNLPNNRFSAFGPFTMSENGTATDIQLYANGDNGHKFTFGIYLADGPGGSPGTLVAKSAELVLAAGMQWQQVAIGAALTSGTAYWLCVNCGGGTGTCPARYSTPAGAPTVYFSSNTYSGGNMPDPAPTGEDGGYIRGFYINYTAGAGGGGKPWYFYAQQ